MEVPAENKNVNHKTMEMNDESVGHEKESYEKSQRPLVTPDKNDKQKNKHRVKSGNADGKAVDKAEKISSKSAKTNKKLPVRYGVIFLKLRFKKA